MDLVANFNILLAVLNKMLYIAIWTLGIPGVIVGIMFRKGLRNIFR